MIPVHLLLGLGAAGVYALSSMASKRAFDLGVGVRQLFLVSNLALGLTFLPLAFMTEGPVPWEQALRPVIAGLLFFVGHALVFKAIQLGQISLVTPLLGTKVIFVVAATRLFFGIPLRLEHVGAAILTAIGVLIMGGGGLSSWTRMGPRQATAVAMALGCSMSFGACDALIQEWSIAMGSRHFISLMFGTLSLVSLVFVPMEVRGVARLTGIAWRWMGISAFLTSIQALLITVGIAWGRDAAGVNVVYSLRGVFGLLLVWVAGAWFLNKERSEVGARALLARLVGALMIVGAVAWILLATPKNGGGRLELEKPEGGVEQAGGVVSERDGR